MTTATTAEPWAFWSPTTDDQIDHALELGNVGPGVRFLDLGCGDGRTLVAAAKRGAAVRGIEISPGLAERARANLAANGIVGTVEVADFAEADLDTDVAFSYLTPVVLSLISDRLEQLPLEARIVTSRYRLPGWAPVADRGGCYLYQTPRTSASVQGSGWNSRATLVVLPAAARVLVPLTFTTNSQCLEMEVADPIGRAANLAVGRSRPGERTQVPIDVIFRAHAVGTVVAGEIRLQGEALTLAAVFSAGARGMWNFGPSEGTRFREALSAAITDARSGLGKVVAST